MRDIVPSDTVDATHGKALVGAYDGKAYFLHGRRDRFRSVVVHERFLSVSVV
jgi:hypothetical protein